MKLQRNLQRKGLSPAFQPYRDEYTDAAFEDTVSTRDTLRQRLITMVVFVASTADGEIVGTVACQVIDADEGHMGGMAVRPRWQGRGIAQQLLDAAESELRRQKCSFISLDTTRPLRTRHSVL